MTAPVQVAYARLLLRSATKIVLLVPSVTSAIRTAVLRQNMPRWAGLRRSGYDVDVRGKKARIRGNLRVAEDAYVVAVGHHYRVPVRIVTGVE